jgi:uncharacterized delta-60 repeat protein
MSLKTKISGTWRELSIPYTKVSGVWKPVKSAYLKISGVWKEWFLQGGLLDVEFSNNVSNISWGSGFWEIRDIGIQSNNKIIIVGNFTVTGAQIEGSARLNPDGTLDPSFLGTYIPGAKLVILPDDKTIIVGPFQRGITKLFADGATDTSFRSNIGTGFNHDFFSRDFRALKVQEDGKILVCGQFTTFNNTSANYLARLNPDGTLDSLFQTNLGTGPSINPPFTTVEMEALAVQTDGKILIGGRFDAFNGTTAKSIARLNSNGTFDSSFMENAGSAFNGDVESLSIQQDGKIIVGGTFSTFNQTSVNGLIRLNSDGTLDPSFSVTGGVFNVPPETLFLPSGQIFIYGFSVQSFNSLLTKGVSRRNSDGTLDSSFMTNVGAGAEYSSGDTRVESAKLQEDGKVIICGRITTFNGISSPRIARIGGKVAAQ